MPDTKKVYSVQEGDDGSSKKAGKGGKDPTELAVEMDVTKRNTDRPKWSA